MGNFYSCWKIFVNSHCTVVGTFFVAIWCLKIRTVDIRCLAWQEMWRIPHRKMFKTVGVALYDKHLDMNHNFVEAKSWHFASVLHKDGEDEEDHFWPKPFGKLLSEKVPLRQSLLSLPKTEGQLRSFSHPLLSAILHSPIWTTDLFSSSNMDTASRCAKYPKVAKIDAPESHLYFWNSHT